MCWVGCRWATHIPRVVVLVLFQNIPYVAIGEDRKYLLTYCRGYLQRVTAQESCISQDQ